MEYVLVILFIILNMSISALQGRQDRIESKLNKIIEHLGIPEPSIENIDDELKDELIKLVGENKKVRAVKRVRDVTGMGLREAKDYVDRLE